MIATVFPVSSSISGMNLSSAAISISPAKRLIIAMLIGSSTSPLLHASSHGCGHTRPIHAGSGILSLINSFAFSNSPFATRPT